MRVLTPDTVFLFLSVGWNGMPATASAWELEVDRGPDWLFVKVCVPKNFRGEDPPLADLVWEQLQQHFVYRLALELDDVPLMHSFLLGQLVILQKRIAEHGGVMRVCGLSPMNQRVLEMHGLDHEMPNYGDRTEAVMAPRLKPR